MRIDARWPIAVLLAAAVVGACRRVEAAQVLVVDNFEAGPFSLTYTGTILFSGQGGLSDADVLGTRRREEIFESAGTGPPQSRSRRIRQTCSTMRS